MVADTMHRLLRFTDADVDAAHDAWRASCGPVAIAAIMCTTLDAVRPHLADYKGFMNPTMMWAALKSMGARITVDTKPLGAPAFWPVYGIARIQWGGPWMERGVPVGAQYQRTHWVASNAAASGPLLFDVNCMRVGGWVDVKRWETRVVPWILRENVPKNDGTWTITHTAEIDLSIGAGFRA